MDNQETLQRLSGKFRTIGRADPGTQPPGAKAFRRAFQPAKAGEILQLEAVLGHELPEQYRRFLLEIGYGAGPGLGLLSPAEAIQTLHYAKAKSSADEERRTGLADNDLRDVSELTQARLEQFFQKRARDQCLHVFTVGSYDGTLCICKHGGGWSNDLITGGPFRGRVLDEVSLAADTSYDHPGDWFAAYAPAPGAHAASLPTFFEWIESCADALLDRVGRSLG